MESAISNGWTQAPTHQGRTCHLWLINNTNHFAKPLWTFVDFLDLFPRSHRILVLCKFSTVLSFMTPSPTPPSRPNDTRSPHNFAWGKVEFLRPGDRWLIYQKKPIEKSGQIRQTVVGQFHPGQYTDHDCVSIWIYGCIQTDIKYSSLIYENQCHIDFSFHHFSKFTNSSKDLSPDRFNSCR